MQTATPDKLTGSIERVTFHNSENGFCVLQIKVKGKADLLTVVGNAITVNAGEYIECVGSWSNHKDHGLQFNATTINLIQPDTVDGIEKYLGSGLIKGVGPGFAKRLVTKFGVNVFKIIEEQPHKLLTVPGLGESRQQKIIAAWEEQKQVKEIVIFLHSYGVSTARAVRIHKTYGNNAIATIKANPYQLANDIRGIGFKTADQLALQMGIAVDSLVRAQAGIKHMLQEYSGNGHCAVLQDELIGATSELLEVPQELVHSALIAELTAKTVILDDFNGEPGIFLAGFYKAEVAVAAKLTALNAVAPRWAGIDPVPAITWVEKKVALSLSASQRLAIEFALKSKVMIITGGPGVGKTTLVNSILKIIGSKTTNIMLAAPTGRAAKRLTETTGLAAKTLHRLLGTRPGEYGFQYNEHNKLPCELLIIDEISMVDILMFNNVLKAVPESSGLILVGDVDQLPSVGPGAVLADLIKSQCLPVISLTEVFRQAAASQIIVSAHRINQGLFPKLEYDPQTNTDFYFIRSEEPEIIKQKLLAVVSSRIPEKFQFATTDIQVLTPMNRGSLGTQALNIALKQALNPSAKVHITRYGTTFSVHDKIIQTVNNYDKEVFNGDIGVITAIDLEESEVVINFEERFITYSIDELDEIALAYAISIHKSQGSEYPAIVMPITTQHFTLLERNLLYTGVTRGKKLVVLIGQVKALAIAIKNKRASNRLTKLAQRLQAPF